MDWYYKVEDTRVGPIADEKMRELALQGTITPETEVWNELVAKWLPYSEISGGAKPSAGPGPSGPAKEETEQSAHGDPYADLEGTDRHADSYAAPEALTQKTESYCSQCFNKFPVAELIQYGDSNICAACKPLFFQKLKEGAATTGVLRYAGFWVRFVAKFIDIIILWIVGLLIYYAAFMLFFLDDNFLFTPARMMVFMLVYVLQISFNIAYATFFIGKHGATPGKMALSLSVVNPDGSKVSYLKAFGRFFAEMVSGIILAIGYIMAAFDDEKRALHDRICSTRVIKKSA
jgi:uncharacterized RDD family membrane protein YckC